MPGWVGGAAAVLALLLTLFTWAFASLIGSSPDDDSHLANIYCLHDSSTCRSQDWDWAWIPPYWPPDPADREGPDWDGIKKVYPDLWEYEQARKLPTPTMTGEFIRRLSWCLEGPSIELLVAPDLGDVSGPRLNVRPAAGD